MYQALYDEGIAVEQVIDFIADTPGVSGNALQACANGSFDDAHKKIATASSGVRRSSSG